MLSKNLLLDSLKMFMRTKSVHKILFYAQIFNMCIVAGLTTWNLVQTIKYNFIVYDFNEFNVWTKIFFNPTKAPLVNYLVSSFVMLICFLYFYLKSNTNFNRIIYSRKNFLIVLMPLLFYFFSYRTSGTLKTQTAVSILILMISFIDFNKISIFITRILLIISIVIFGLIGFEAISLINGPVKVVSEYIQLPSTTKINDVYINVDDIGQKIESSLREEFIRNNYREYFYQLSNRGVFNHIGHVINPVNEYSNGKPISEIYFQYGIGFSFIYKLTMEFFGGVSVDNYFKCHIFYIIYWSIYFFVSIYIFRSEFYIFFSILALAMSFFYIGYDAFLIAPGINPLIHFFDLLIIFFLFRYFKNRKSNDLIFALVSGIFGVFINQQFGLFGILAATISLTVFYLENYSGVKRIQIISLLPFAVFFPLILSRFFFHTATYSIFGYFLKGYFSFQPDRGLVCLIITITALSYAFLIWKKNDRTPFKYLFVFLFLYFQALLIYYYWSGLTNHFLPLIPIMSLQLLVMTRFLNKIIFINYKLPRMTLIALVLLISIHFTVKAGEFYYRQKKTYSKIFETHKVYSWNFNRAKIISTIDPEPLGESIEILRKYSGIGKHGNGVFILTVFDNILPLLAERYSLMPSFDMQWFLITKKEVNDTVLRIKRLKPQYIFIGREVEVEHFFNPWHVIYDESVGKDERISASGRLQELRNVFLSIKSDYTPIAKSELLTVYKLNN